MLFLDYLLAAYNVDALLQVDDALAGEVEDSVLCSLFAFLDVQDAVFHVAEHQFQCVYFFIA